MTGAPFSTVSSGPSVGSLSPSQSVATTRTRTVSPRRRERVESTGPVSSTSSPFTHQR